MRTTLAARMQLVGSQLQIEGTIQGLLKAARDILSIRGSSLPAARKGQPFN